jgi:hypothetical protein
MPNQNEGCRFCGRTDLTREHIWPRWLRKYLKYDDTGHHGHGTGGVEMQGRIGTLHPNSVRFRTGDIRSRKVRLVCRKCNSEWMSRLQQKAKPLLLPLIRGEWIDLSANDQKIISSWAIMFTMVIELLDPRTDAHSFDQRNEFSKTSEPPPGWFIWIGQANDWPWPFWHYGWGIHPDRPKDFTPLPNVQTTTFGVGHLLFHTLSFGPPLEKMQPPLGIDTLTEAFDVARILPVSHVPAQKPKSYVPKREIIGLSASTAMFFGGYVDWQNGHRGVFRPSILFGGRVGYWPINRLTIFISILIDVFRYVRGRLARFFRLDTRTTGGRH